jgi:AraC-like DNA-binding protein
MSATVAMHYVRLVTDYCGRHGVPSVRLLAPLGRDVAMLEDREARLPYAEFHALLEEASRILSDANLGLHVGVSAQPGYYGPYGFTLMTCRTTRDLLARSVRYSALVSDAYRIEVEQRTDEVIRYWKSNLPDPTLPGRLHEQLNLAAWITMARWVTALPDLAPRWIACRHRPAPDDERAYESVLRCRVMFGAPDTAVGFDPRQLDLPLSQADREVQRMMEAVCLRIEQRLGTTVEPPWMAACRAEIVTSLANGEPVPEDIAAATELTVVELKQRLAARGTSLRELIGNVRRELAMSYVHDPSLTFIDIACMLGFSEQSAFQRAFKRWTGQTPGEYRRRLSGGS